MTEEHEKYSKSFFNFCKEKEWLFTESKEFVPILDYLAFFYKKYNQKFLYFPLPLVYEKELVDSYRENLVYSTFLTHNNGAKQMYSLFQISEETHLYIGWNYFPKEDRFFAGIEIYTSIPTFFLEFVKKHENIAFKIEQKPVGFFS